MTEDLNRITREINYLVVSEVEKRAAKHAEKSQRYFDLKSMIQDLANEGEILYANYKAEGFSAGMIEAEGFLRCAKILLNMIRDLEN